ncbi:uncharacterized protein RJT21DRAFT_52283 [Scheffersomyces amazonensis]|uniref:uncharacterized protein n=1 Tax=Scheffersomyces amazonensis TaxID=1078765 RepID=UPI00315DBE7A
MMKSKSQSLHLYEMQGSLPSYNVKATIVPCEGTDIVFLYGGFDDSDQLDGNVYLLNLKTKIWEVDDKHEGIYRDGHSAIHIGNGNVLVFGGVPYDEEFADTVSISNRRNQNQNHIPNQNQNHSFNKNSIMLIYNIYTKKWIGPPDFALSNAPAPRSRHASCLSRDGSKLYISGGLTKSSNGNVCSEDLYCYDLTSGNWMGPIRFVSRFDHFIKIHDDKLYSFGGLDRDMNHVVNTVSFYSFKTKEVGEITLYSPYDYQYTPPSDKRYFFGEERIFLDSKINSSLTLKMFLPPWNSNIAGLHIDYFNTEKYETLKVCDVGSFAPYFKQNYIDIMSYSWKMGFIHTGDDSLYLLGNKFRRDFEEQPLGNENENENGDGDGDGDGDSLDPKLTSLLKVKLSSLGIPSSNSIQSYSSNKSQLTVDLKKLLTDEEFTDFEILAFKDETDKCEYSEYSDSFDIENLSKSNKLISIKVHKAILIARWPHFHRLISIGMNETIHNKMLIPEPQNWVKGLIFFLYSGSIEFEDYIFPEFTILDYLGLLILSNLYNLPDLKEVVLFQLYREFEEFQIQLFKDPENEQIISILLKLWKELSIGNIESIFLMKVIELIKSIWSTITRSNAFLSLSKELIIKLCQDSSDEMKSESNLATPESSHGSFDQNNYSDDLETPARVSSSPFVIDLVHPTHRQSSSFSSLQHLTGVLNDNLHT